MQLDRRQEPLALQAVLVELVGLMVRGHADTTPRSNSPLEQAPHDHRVGDVGHVELVEAEQAVAPRDAPGDARRADPRCPCSVVQLAVHVLHEAVEVHAPLRVDRRRSR